MSLAANQSTSSSPVPWLFSARVDLWTFGGSAIASILLLAIGGVFGWLNQDTPSWAWVVAILLIDVAHVYSTGFRVYFDRVELSRRPWLYSLTPLLAFGFSWAIYSESHSLFWRCLAYLAVFHFVRQQYGWVALYRAKAGEDNRLEKWIDTAAIYLATVYPLVYWHCHLPREFWWFRADDFATFSLDWSRLVAPIYWLSMTAYVLKAGWLAWNQRRFNPGKDLVVATTALCWYIGIITFNSDYAFTVTNVIIHGIPYMVLVYWYRQKSLDANPPSSGRGRAAGRVARFIGLIWILAYIEELIWDRGIWHERSWLFGSAWNLESVEALLVPLLAVPQITHYVLDGFIWKRRSSKTLDQITNNQESDPRLDSH